MASVARRSLPKPKARAALRSAAPAAAGRGAPGAGLKIAGPAATSSRFARVVELLKKSAATVKRHAPAAKKAAEAQAAAVSPPQERTAGAQANQVDVMKGAEAKTPEKTGFLAMLRQQIQQIMPKDLNSADSFMKGDEKEQIKGAVSGGVKDQKQEAAGPTQQAAAAAPDTSAVEAREATPMPAEAPPAPAAVPGAEAMPAPQPPEATASFQKSQEDGDKKVAETQMSPDELQEANDPRFSKVVKQRGALQKEDQAAPGQYRGAEAATLKAAGKEADASAAVGLRGMLATRGVSAAAVKTRQQLAKERDEARRKEVALHIQEIYERTKKRVEAKLDALEPEVLGLFDRGADAALERMKSSANKEIDAFKDDRYSGLRGKARWLADKFRDVPQEIKDILKRARERFMQEMDALAVQIAALVDRRVAEAKAEIGKGEAEIKAYVAGLPKDLQGVGKAAAEQIATKFDELRSSVDDRQNALAQKLAQKFKEASDKSAEALKKLEDENKGFFKGLVDAVADVINAIREFKDRMVAVFKKGLDTIMLIVKHPIRFLGYLLDAVKKGFGQFVDHIWDHLKAGFMQWLFGSLADTGIELPKDFSLGSILKLVLQVLGITYDRMRAKAVKLLGERAVAILEKVFGFLYTLVTAGPAKMWEEMKEYLSDLKGQVIDAIQNWVITTIIKAAVTKLVTMFNPVGAIVQAIITIYNFVMFIIEQAKKIMALIEAIVNSVAEIAAGAISTAANWIEQALARLIPVAIGLLARLIGLSGITDKIKEIIKKVQGMVDKAIDKVIEKIIGVVKKLFGAGKAAVKAIVEWWKARVKFRSTDGEEHDLSFQGEGAQADLVVASTPARPVEKVLATRDEALKKPEDRKLIGEARKVLAEMRAAMAKSKSKAGGTDVAAGYDESLKQLIDAKMKVLADLLQKILGPASIDPTKVEYAPRDGRGGTVTAAPLTLLSGNTTGSEASRSLFITGWPAAAAYNKYVEDEFVRAHLLAHLLHGPGNFPWNLAAATKEANKELELDHEHPAAKRIGTEPQVKKLKADTKVETIKKYETKVTYWAASGPLAGFAHVFRLVVTGAGGSVTSASPKNLAWEKKRQVPFRTDAAPLIAIILDCTETDAGLIITSAGKTPKTVPGLVARLTGQVEAGLVKRTAAAIQAGVLRL